MRTILMLAGLVLSLPRLAYADSDFYYCAARGYLAYETRLGTKPAKHELHIVRFGNGGIVAAAPIVLDEFQVHGMTCRAGAVEIHGWERIYSVNIRNVMRPSITSRAAAFDPQKSPTADHLGILGSRA